MPHCETTLVQYECRLSPDGSVLPGLRTITGTSPEDAVRQNLAVLAELGVGGPAGFHLHHVQVVEEPWEPRVPLAYPIVGRGLQVTGPQMTREGLPVITNAQEWRYRVTLTVGHSDAYIGPNPDARWREQLEIRPVLPREADPRGGASGLRVKLRDGSMADTDGWIARNGLTRKQAVRVLTDCGLELEA